MESSPGTGTKIFVRRANNSDPMLATIEEIESPTNIRERVVQLDENFWIGLPRRVTLRDNEVGSWVGFVLFPQLGATIDGPLYGRQMHLWHSH